MWFIPFTFRDFIDIILVATILFWIYRSTRGTNAPYILTGVGAMYVLWVVVKGLNMELLSTILGQIMAVGVIAMIVIFQPEIRRFLQLIRIRKKHLRFLDQILGRGNSSNVSEIDPVIEAVKSLSRSHTGGIIVLAQHSDLSLITEGGVAIDAKLSQELLLTLMGEKSPLRKGAMVVERGRIVSVGCFLPMTQSQTPDSYTIRQKAALGLSEISDSVIITIDAFDGAISVVNSGCVKEKIAVEDIAEVLREYVSIYDAN